MTLRPLLLSLVFALPLSGCIVIITDDDDAIGDDDDATEEVPFRIWGPDFLSDDGITHSYDCDQALPPENSCLNPNPEIRWEGAPEGTESFVLIFDDVSFNNNTHWAILNIPGDATGLDADISGDGASGSIPGGSTELGNGFGEDGYLGSCPGGVNHYRWRLWALDTELDASLYTALGSPQAAYSALSDDAQEIRLDRVEMCHVFDGANAQR